MNKNFETLWVEALWESYERDKETLSYEEQVIVKAVISLEELNNIHPIEGFDKLRESILSLIPPEVVDMKQREFLNKRNE